MSERGDRRRLSLADGNGNEAVDAAPSDLSEGGEEGLRSIFRVISDVLGWYD